MVLLCGTIVLCLMLSACDWISSGEEEDVAVVPYEGPPITEADAQTTTDPLGGRGWHAEVDGETVVLERPRFCGAECSETYRLELRSRGASALPSFVSASFERMEYIYGNDGRPRRTTEGRALRRGVVAIQHWNLDGVVSGKVSGDLAEDLFFWYDLSER